MDNGSLFSCILCQDHRPPRLIAAVVKGDVHDRLKAVECRACRHVQLDPPDYSLEFYNEDGQVNFVVHDYGTPIDKLFDHSVIEATRRVRRFAEHGIALDSARPSRVLDVGGGYGFFGSAMKRDFPNFDVAVMEPSATRAQTGKDYLAAKGEGFPPPRYEVSLLDNAYAEQYRGHYDLVTLWHVLEHVTEPVELLKFAREILAPGGVLCVEVPNLDDELIGLSPAFRDRWFMKEHVSYFSPYMLETVARRAAPDAEVTVSGYQRYGIFNYFHWIHFNKPQGANPDLFEGQDRWWLEAGWRATREAARTSDALFMSIRPPG